ncbi:hypothetical protein KI688_002312 [Linnemannia hyalina]|uniref:F-box domain-containing protein n=1 Tax=Linnemannia hyalina TaxID=64524 RepID=A0A9P7XRP3_9FUNG|nr:hypothetical protein KI688_002312 [Linnemannia hyalina]
MEMTRRPSEEALGLLELVSLISNFLDPPDLFSCVQVSRLWNKATVPSLWHTINDNEYQWPKILKAHDYPRINNGKDRNWIRATFTKYGAWIRVLSIHWRVTLDVAHFCGSCTRIHTLILSNPFKNKTLLEEQEFRAIRWREPRVAPGTGIIGLAVRIAVDRISLSSGGPIASETPGEREASLQQREWAMTNLFLRLIQKNHGLSGVRLSSTLQELQTVDFPSSIYDTLASKRRFHVLENYADCNDLGALLETLPHIRYYSSSSWTVSSSPFQTALPSLQALRLQDCIDTLLFASILQHLPNLRSLWTGGFRVATPYCKENFIHEVKNNIKPTTLQLLYLGRTTPLEDEMLRATIPCLPDLRDLTSGNLDETTILTLVECCRQLETVTLSVDQDSAKPVPENALSYFLEGCPKLRVLDASRYTVDATQLKEGRVWVCRDLEVLKCQIIGIEHLLQTDDEIHGTISTTPGDMSRFLTGQQSAFHVQQQSQNWHHQVYSRLASLTKLTTLVLWLDPVLEGAGSLEFTLETGMVEIRINIRRYLRTRDLKQCILVCRDWWRTFEPLICNETSVRLRRHESVFGPQGQPDEWDQLNQDQDLSSTPRQPSAYSIVRHRHQVYSLGSFRLELAYIPFGNLRSIVLGSGDLNTNDLTPWIHFLRGCKDSLQELELVGFRTLPEAHFWEMLMLLPRLRELQIHHGGIVEYDQARVFWKVCSRLESLKLRQTYFTHLTGTSYPYPDLSNMKELFLSNIGMEFERQARIVAQCGQLRRLWWKTPQISEARDDVIPHIEDAILSRRLSRLEGMRIETSTVSAASHVLSESTDRHCPAAEGLGDNRVDSSRMGL